MSGNTITVPKWARIIRSVHISHYKNSVDINETIECRGSYDAKEAYAAIGIRNALQVVAQKYRYDGNASDLERI